ERERVRLLSSENTEGTAPSNLQQRIILLEAKRTITDKGHAIFDAGGREIFGRIRLALPPPGFSDVSFHDVASPRLREARAQTYRLHDGNWLVVVSHSEIVDDLNDVLGPLSLALLVTAIAGGLLATNLLGRQIASRLQRIEIAAEAISLGNLDSRVPVEGLDGIFRQQAESFNRMLDRIAGLIASQRQFSSSLAHELRTPLTRLRGILRGAEDEGEKLPKRVQSILERAERESASTIRIFDALLRLSEIEAGRHPSAMAPVNLREVVADVVESMDPVLSDVGCELRLGSLASASVIADRELLVQLVANVIENIALHTPAGTQAMVAVFRRGDQAIVRISDNGPGLPVGKLTTVLAPFERGPNSKTVRGSGLGLAIAKAIVEFHQGDLRLSDNGPGLAVEIVLPGIGHVTGSDASKLSPSAAPTLPHGEIHPEA
ncbi:MAG: hypothetical protein RIQ99_445, partial [Pseudomonadota bacterium]